MPRKSDKPINNKILIIENNDEVFASIYAVLYGNFSEIKRAKCATEADSLIHSEQFDSVLSNVDLPDQTAWLLVNKWHISGGIMPTWVYSANESKSMRNWIKFSNANGVIFYNGDLVMLANKIHQLFCYEKVNDSSLAFAVKGLLAASIAGLSLWTN